eukprot:766706-Hanusia_phi.AAC.3
MSVGHRYQSNKIREREAQATRVCIGRAQMEGVGDIITVGKKLCFYWFEYRQGRKLAAGDFVLMELEFV